jgi:hypothetical protein
VFLDDVWRQGKSTQRNVYCTAGFGTLSGVQQTPYIHVQMWTVKSTSGYDGPTTPLPKKVLLKSRLQLQKCNSTGIFPLTRIPTGFALTSRSQFPLIRRFALNWPESVHTDPTHGWFSPLFRPAGVRSHGSGTRLVQLFFPADVELDSQHIARNLDTSRPNAAP